MISVQRYKNFLRFANLVTEKVKFFDKNVQINLDAIDKVKRRLKRRKNAKFLFCAEDEQEMARNTTRGIGYTRIEPVPGGRLAFAALRRGR